MQDRGAGPASDVIGAAHARVLADRSIQFEFGQIPPPQPPPSWLIDFLKALAQVLKPIAPAIPYLLWGALGLGVLFILVLLAREMLSPRWSRDRDSGLNLKAAEDWRPTRKRAEALLQDADRLAAEGRYAEAVHLLLLRSVEDLETRRPGLITPSLTSRDIARLEAVPPQPRSLFAGLAAVVERAVFGGRAVDAEGWAACRQAYSAFVFPQAWSGAA